MKTKMQVMKVIRTLIFVCSLLVGLTTLSGCQEAAQKGDGLLITGTSSDRLVKFPIDGFPSSYAVSVSSTSVVPSDVKASLAVDLDLVDKYNSEMGTNYYPVPEGSYSFDNSEVTIAAGQAVSSAANLSIADDSEFVPGRVYLVPVTIKHATGNMDIIESSRTIYLKVARTLRFYAPYVGQASMAYQFLLPDPIQSLPTYTWEVKIYATKFRSSGASGTTRVCSFGGNETSVEGGAINDGGFKCDQNLLRFGEGTDDPNQLHVTTKQGKMSSNTRFALNTWYAVALVNDGNTLTLYINGEKDNSMTVAPYEYSLYGVQIGMPSSGYQSSQLFYGRLSEMRLWTRPLSAREIKANMCGVDPSTSGLVSYWRMNEGEGKTFYDLSPSKRDISYKNDITIDWTYDDTNKCLE
jgi:hypothetical protein